jgi:hypothetical protein
VLEEALGILRADRRDRRAYRFHQCLAGARLHLAQQSLDLGKGLFDRIEVRRVRWQEV